MLYSDTTIGKVEELSNGKWSATIPSTGPSGRDYCIGFFTSAEFATAAIHTAQAGALVIAATLGDREEFILTKADGDVIVRDRYILGHLLMTDLSYGWTLDLDRLGQRIILRSETRAATIQPRY